MGVYMFKLARILLISFFITTFSLAQYTPGNNYIGPSVGLSFLGSTAQFGINFEHAMKLDFGTVGIGGIFRYWGYSENFGGGKWGYTDILIGAQGNYHFIIENNKFAPWIGLTLAYDAGSVSWDGPNSYSYATPAYGGFFIGADAGARYWFSPNIALSARVGVGTLSYSALDVGVDFKL